MVELLSTSGGRTSLGKAHYELLRNWILQLADVTEAPHQFAGSEFRVGAFQFMHFHGYTHLDIRLSKEDQTRVLKEGKAERHLYAPQAGWITFRIHSVQDIGQAKELIELGYNNARKIVEQQKQIALPETEP